jgi:four helix bundle protein
VVELEAARRRGALHFEQLKVWQESRLLCHEVYRATTSTALHHDFTLKHQLRKTAISVMSNIAEGFERGGSRDFARFLEIAKASCGELRSQIILAFNLGYIPQDEFDRVVERSTRLSRMLYRLSHTYVSRRNRELQILLKPET